MKFTATSRSVQGSSASRRLRRAGRVPAIVYGADEPAVSIELDHNEIYHAVRKEAFHSSVLEMVLDGESHEVLLRSVQWHPYKPLVLHVDFLRIKRGQALTTRIPVHFHGEEESPAVKLENAQFSFITTELEVTCLPRDLPSSIQVDVSGMHAGETLHLSSITAPEGVEFTGLGEDEDPVLALAAVIHEQADDSADEAVAEGEESAEAAPEATEE